MSDVSMEQAHAKALGRDIGAEMVAFAQTGEVTDVAAFAIDRLTNGFGMDPKIAKSEAFWDGVHGVLDATLDGVER